MEKEKPIDQKIKDFVKRTDLMKEALDEYTKIKARIRLLKTKHVNATMKDFNINVNNDPSHILSNFINNFIVTKKEEKKEGMEFEISFGRKK